MEFHLVSGTFANASTCIREGFDHLAQLAVRYFVGNKGARVRTHKMATQLGDLSGLDDMSFAQLRAHVSAALSA